MTATKIQPGDDTHLTLLMTPHSLNFVTGPDRAALLAYGRDVFAAGLAGAAPAAVAGPAREQIAALRAEHGITSSGRGIKEFEQVDAFVRAVLQRWGAAPALEATAAPAVPPGFTLVPLRLTRAMDEAISEEGWQWEDLLAAARAVTEEQYEASAQDRLSQDEVREIFLECGFTIKQGQTDLKPYVYEAAQALEAHVRAALAAAPQAPAAPAVDAPIVWPKARDVGRIGDKSPSAHLRIGLDSDNDVWASIWDERGGATIEFCTPGAGGGKSSRTRMALLAVMVAMEADNAADPRRDWWAERNGEAQAQQKGL